MQYKSANLFVTLARQCHYSLVKKVINPPRISSSENQGFCRVMQLLSPQTQLFSLCFRISRSDAKNLGTSTIFPAWWTPPVCQSPHRQASTCSISGNAIKASKKIEQIRRRCSCSTLSFFEQWLTLIWISFWITKRKSWNNSTFIV